MSFDLILPFLRPIERFLADDEITEIMVNPSGRVFIERLGMLAEAANVAVNAKYLNVAVKNIARLLEKDISESRPILDARLLDGSRVAAVFAPCSVGGTTLTIRKFRRHPFTIAELVRVGSLDEETACWLVGAVRGKKNVLISGGTGAGKTTLLSALLAEIPDDERIILIEDTAEICLAKPNLVRFEAQRANGTTPEIPIRDLVKASLRHRPDRIIVGEVRGGEAFDLLQALNTGHAGAVSTLHASSAERALTRFAHCILESGVALPYAAACRQISDAIDVVVQVERREGLRLVTEVAALDGFEDGRGAFVLRSVYRFDPDLGGLEGDEPGSFPPGRVRSLAGESSRISRMERSA
jgi:pilus assembly protein CpaF